MTTAMNGIYQPVPTYARAVQGIPPSTCGEDLPADLGDNVMRAISQEIVRIATLCEKTPSPRAFFLIGKLAAMARDVKNLDASLDGGCSSNSGGMSNAWMGANVYGQAPGVPLAPAPQAETFGVNAIREVVAAASRRKPEEIVAAIAEAKKARMPDLVRALRAQLNLDDEKPPSPRSKKRKSTWGKKAAK